jgi:hypothetical protein
VFTWGILGAYVGFLGGYSVISSVVTQGIFGGHMDFLSVHKEKNHSVLKSEFALLK